MSNKKISHAFAPASIGNLAVGFDCLGMALEGVGDEVIAQLIPISNRSDFNIEIEIEGKEKSIPVIAEENTAGVAVKSLLESQNLPFSVHLKIIKGIPLSSGMGGSASSAVAATMAVNELFENPLEKNDLLKFALKGESLSSGSLHGDNVVPSLFGGIQLLLNDNDFIQVPSPSGLTCLLAHPPIQLDTKSSRENLMPNIQLNDFVKQSSSLAGFICACYTDNKHLLRVSMKDYIIEQQRSSKIPEFEALKKISELNNSLCFSISGAGPSVFVWLESEKVERLKKSFSEVYNTIGMTLDFWESSLNAPGARIIK